MADLKLLIVKLRTGEQIAGVSEENEDTILMRKPIKIHDSFNDMGDYTLSYYLENTEGSNITLSKTNDIFFVSTPSKEMKFHLLAFTNEQIRIREHENQIKEQSKELIEFLQSSTLEESEMDKLITMLIKNPSMYQFVHFSLNAFETILRESKKEAKKRQKAKKKVQEKPETPKQTFEIPFDEKKDEKHGSRPEDWSPDIKDYM